MELRIGFIEEVKGIIANSREDAIRSVDNVRVKMYWKLGRKIVEEEQQGKERAEYAKFLLKNLSKELTSVFGESFSKRQLERYRQFYRLYPIASAVRTQFSWTHYKLFLSLKNESKRLFYQTESHKNNWSSRQLERQINSQLYERLLLSSNPSDVRSVK